VPARIAIAIACLAALVAFGCGGREDESTPVACLEGADAYLAALAEAPSEVELDDEVTISDCLAENQDGGELATVGEAMVGATTELNAEARAEPGGAASVQLGYLLGAAQRGADRTEGIHADLVRRLVVAARFAPGREPLPQSFLDAFREGFDAGREQG